MNSPALFAPTVGGDVWSHTVGGDVWSHTVGGDVWSHTVAGDVWSHTVADDVWSHTVSGDPLHTNDGRIAANEPGGYRRFFHTGRIAANEFAGIIRPYSGRRRLVPHRGRRRLVHRQHPFSPCPLRALCETNQILAYLFAYHKRYIQQTVLGRKEHTCWH